MNNNTNKITLSNSEKLSLIMSLATMLSAGIAILEVVDSLAEDAKGNSKKLLLTLREDIISGNQIHTSFAKYPKVFNKITVNIIKAAEQGGTLDTTLKDIRKNIQDEIEFADKIKSALLYPILIMIVFVGVILMILTVVMPKIALVFGQLKVPLPLPTKILIFLSNLLIHQTIFVLVGLGIIVGSIIFLFETRRNQFLGVIFSLPIISTIVREVDLTRFARSLSLLLASGIPIISALELSQDVIMRNDIRTVIGKSREMVLSGKKLSEGLKLAKGKIPTIMIKIIEAGERTGSLDRSMQDISAYLDYEVTSNLKTFTTLLEPILLVLVGVAVGSIMLSIIGPIYSLIGKVGAR